MKNPLLFWHENLGRHLRPDLPPEKTPQCKVEQRLKKGVLPHPVGAKIPFYYLVQEGFATVVGMVNLPDTSAVRFVPSETVSATSFLMRQLIERETFAPFMLGVIRDASPISSFAISATPSFCVFCESGKSFSFDLPKAQRAYKLFLDAGVPWRTPSAKKISISNALRQRDALRSAGPGELAGARAAFLKLIDQNPDFVSKMESADIRSDSGEARVLSWIL